ncbi:MAG: SOS response-associated peptidase [Chloroflexota bacterium]
MCGRYTLEKTGDELAKRFRVLRDPPPALEPRYNVAPTQAVVTVTAEGERRLERMTWGLIPRWAKDPRMGSKLINARAETLADKPAFRGALKHRRCLIPADSFYEWTAAQGGKAKQPVRVTLASGEPFAFAGLWETWTPPEGGDAVKSCTIITTAPNALMANLHHRMPVILTQEAEDAWLDPSITEPEQLLPLLAPYPAEGMTWYHVSPLVNSPANEGPQLALPLE